MALKPTPMTGDQIKAMRLEADRINLHDGLLLTAALDEIDAQRKVLENVSEAWVKSWDGSDPPKGHEACAAEIGRLRGEVERLTGILNEQAPEGFGEAVREGLKARAEGKRVSLSEVANDTD